MLHEKHSYWFLISIVLLAACHKYQTSPGNHAQPSIVGKWNVDTVTTYFYDSAGLREMGVHVYPAGAPDYPYHLEINNDYSWVESLHMQPTLIILQQPAHIQLPPIVRLRSCM
jgi:hypothetical protein